MVMHSKQHAKISIIYLFSRIIMAAFPPTNKAFPFLSLQFYLVPQSSPLTLDTRDPLGV